MLIEKNFENYFRYFFNNFYDKYIIIKESAKEITPDQNETVSPQIDFKTFLILELTIGLEEKDEKLEKIDELSEDITDEEFKEVKDIFEKIKTEQKSVIQYGLNFADEDDDDNYSIKVLKALHKAYKDTIVIPEFSEYKTNITIF